MRVGLTVNTYFRDEDGSVGYHPFRTIVNEETVLTSNIAERKLAAIMIADVAGFSRLMERDESGTFARLRLLRDEVLGPQVAEHGGRIIKTTGDGFLAEFSSANAALKSGIGIQTAVIKREGEQTDADRIRLRIGINLGDIIIDGDDIAGDGVNIAARLEPLSPPDGLCIAVSVRDQIRDELGVSYEDLGEQTLKNISRTVRAFAVLLEGTVKLSALAGFSVSKPVRGFGGRPAIAVLPFDNMSNDPEQEYFADGLAEDILTRLAMWRWIPAIARNSSFVYRGHAVDLKQVGAALGARYILEGSVRKFGNRVRVTAQLIDTDSGHHVWAERYDRVLEDVFDLQDEITEAIVAALEPAVGQAERDRTHVKNPQSLDAWELCQRGMWHMGKLNKESLAEASTLFLKAAERDPQFAKPVAHAAQVKSVEAWFAWSNPVAAIGEAHRLALAARSIDPLDPTALAVFGVTSAQIGQLEAALEAANKALELNPSFFLGHYILGYIRMLNGQQAEAIAGMDTAARLSPNDTLLPPLFATLSAAHYLNRDYEKAREVAQLGAQRAAQYPMAHRSLANALAQLGRIEEGKQALAKFLDLAPGYSTEVARRSIRFSNEVDFDHYMEGLRKLDWAG